MASAVLPAAVASLRQERVLPVRLGRLPELAVQPGLHQVPAALMGQRFHLVFVRG